MLVSSVAPKDSIAEPLGAGRKVLIIVENLPSPFDRRVWNEATTLQKAGYSVSIICPTGKGYTSKYECLENIHIHRFSLPIEADTALGYLLEYSSALISQFYLSMKVHFKHGFNIIHACNPPDNIFLIGAVYKIFGKKFLFDHHDINPEFYEAKFGRRDFFYKLMLWSERLTFRLADVSIATNESYREIAIERGGMNPDNVFVVRSGPNLDRLKVIPPVKRLKNGRRYLVGYVGVMGKVEGIDHLLRAVEYIVKYMKRTDIQFGLVGGGTELAAMTVLARELEIADFVTFTGRVPDKDVLEMLNTADVCVNPDVANDVNDKSTMNKIMEYMALSKPIVQYDLKEGRVSAQSASLYAVKNDPFDMARKIVELLDDSEARQRMGIFGQRRVRDNLAWAYEAPKLLAAYEAIFRS